MFSIASLITAALFVSSAQDAKAMVFRFNKSDLGKVPAGWKATQTNVGEGSVWKVAADETAPSKSGFVLAQTAESPKAVFNLCVADTANFKDGKISVSFKAVGGKIDQGGGIVWRYQDANNYYVVRMNPLEDNFRVYKVVDGKRIILAKTEDNVKIPSGEWHKIAVHHVGAKIECFLDGKKLLEAADDAITKAGKVGLWTKADAQTYFDDLSVAALPGKKE